MDIRDYTLYKERRQERATMLSEYMQLLCKMEPSVCPTVQSMMIQSVSMVEGQVYNLAKNQQFWAKCQN